MARFRLVHYNPEGEFEERSTAHLEEYKLLAGPFHAVDAILSRLATNHFRLFIYRLRAYIQLDLRHPTFKPDNIITMKNSSAVLAFLVTGTLSECLLPHD